MKSESFTFQAQDKTDIHALKWLPEGDVRAVVLIAHGMAEHAARYERFAGKLCDAGFAVYANDHRGHGQTAGALENVGYFADKDGWGLVTDDLGRLMGLALDENPGRPVFLFGHSMGSILVRDFVFDHGAEVKGVIFSGTVGDPGFMGKIGLAVAKLIARFKGRRHPSPLLTKLSFGEFNKPFKPNRTEFDWLSRDEAEVDKYVADPFCGAVFSAGFWVDFLRALNGLLDPKRVDQIPKDLPVLLFSGEQDPCGANTKGVKQVRDFYLEAGLTDVTCKFYEGGRHEMLNEVNREEVYADVIAWINARL
jgi:alpha-beta hydrolase superfamily lysophospholipase